MAGLIRSAHPVITYNGTNVTAAWVPKLEHLTWKRAIGMNKRADTVSMQLADPDGSLRQTYNVIAKQQLQLQVESESWNYPGEHLLSDATQMEIVRIEITMDKGSGQTLHIEASSIPPSSHFRLTKKSRTAVSTDLKTIAAQIAKENNWTLDYRATVNPKVAYSCQHDQSDAAWLERFCHEQDLTYKPKNGKLTIIGTQQLEAQAPVGTIVCPTSGRPGGINGHGVIHVRLFEDVEDTYAHSVVVSKDVKTGKITTGQADDPDPKGPVLNQVHKPTGVVVDHESSQITQ
jgi:phage protein D